MFSSYTDLPRLGNYAEAVRHYNSIVPIRGSENLRPICNTTAGRRKRHMLIHESTILGCKAMTCQLFQTDVLSFLEDGRVYINNSYASSSTNDFVTQILRGLGRMFFSSQQTWVSSNDKYWKVGEYLFLSRSGSGGWVPETPRRVLRALVDRRAKPYKPFIEHCKNVVKLMDAESVEQSYRGYFGYSMHLPSMADPDRTEWGTLTLAALSKGLRTAYVLGHWKTVLCEKSMMKWLRNYLLESHMYEVYQLEEIPPGTLVKDPNYKITNLITRINK